MWGPSRAPTLDGVGYFMAIIHDLSRKVWIYLLKTKDEAFSVFQEWKKTVEKQTRKKVKALRTENGLEYQISSIYCKNEGIIRHLTVIGTPQQNVIAERINMAILERLRCMGAWVSKGFCGEAAKTVYYLINRCHSTALNFKTPQDIWNGKPHSLSHLKVFLSWPWWIGVPKN